MKRVALALASVNLLACASSGGIAVRPVAGGSALDRLFIAQESVLGLVHQASTLAEATGRIHAYCEMNSAALEEALKELTALALTDGGEALQAESERRGAALQKRIEPLLTAKVRWLEDESLLEATNRCFGQLAEAAPNGEDAEAPEEAPQD